MPAGLLATIGPRVVPQSPPTDQAVAYNFERFDGFEPLDHPAGERLVLPADGPRPGQQATPLAEQTYTPSTLARPVGVVGGQPLPVAPCIFRPPGDYTAAKAPTVQWRLGVGQAGPSSLGVANTLQLNEITQNPPQPGDLASIVGGF
jgi:hypothetical protein